MPPEDILTYRLRRIDERLEAVESSVSALESSVSSVTRMRRDGAVAVTVLLVALAISSPQVWGVVLAYSVSAARAVRGWAP